MPQSGLALEGIVGVSDFSEATMLALAARLEQSSAFQQLIAREIELDELWRRLDAGVKASAVDAGSRSRRRTPEAMFALVWQAHDLAGEGRLLDAAARLRRPSAPGTDA